MVAPIKGEVLQVYLAASEETISAVLTAERKGGQVPIYFVSRVLQSLETRYPEIEKLALALIHAARRLRRYFQAHPIQVLTDKPIKQVLTWPEVSRRLAKWAIELGEHEIEFRPRNAIKGQVMTDFLAETPSKEPTQKRKTPTKEVYEEPMEPETWKLYTDGASSADASGAGLILTNPEGQEFTYALRFNFKTTNNVSEYEALLAELRIAQKMKVKHVHAFVDSQIVAFQVDGTYEAKEPVIPGEERSSIEESSMVAPIEEDGPTWMIPIIDYLTNGTLPADRDQARKIRVKAPQYALRGEGLYKKSYLGPLLRCVGPRQAKEVIQEIHYGARGLHSGPRTPGLSPNGESIIVGPFPTAPGRLKFLVVAIDYFTKWVEAKPLATISGKHMEKFVWEHIITRFGIPETIISDNGKQFCERKFKSFCENLEIHQSFTSVAHPQANGQVESANKSIVKGIKARLGRSQNGWVDELHQVLWAHRTTPKTSNGETPFSLVYGTEAMISAEASVPTARRFINSTENEEQLRTNLDLLEERREVAAIKEAEYKKIDAEVLQPAST
uniref:uncharacterized protein LOC122599476 n=1 Tax=Erigeron canadensis TaxID=72917 RepID=UPI001CB99060|nr:uncharacterized protein LOC122599476 [Erigeron canadensis]